MPKKVFVVWKEENIAGILDDSIFKTEADIINSIPDKLYEDQDVAVEEFIIVSDINLLFK